MMLLRLPLNNKVSLSTTVRTKIVTVQMHERITIPRCMLHKVHRVTDKQVKYKRLMTEWGFESFRGAAGRSSCTLAALLQMPC